jgi:hypothetical protein
MSTTGIEHTIEGGRDTNEAGDGTVAHPLTLPYSRLINQTDVDPCVYVGTKWVPYTLLGTDSIPEVPEVQAASTLTQGEVIDMLGAGEAVPRSLHLSGGYYKIDNTLKLYHGTSITGAGKRNTIVTFNGDKSFCRNYSVIASNDPPTSVRVDNILLESLRIRRYNPTTDSDGRVNHKFPVIDFTDISHSTIRDVEILLSPFPGVSDSPYRTLSSTDPLNVAGIKMMGTTGGNGCYYNKIVGCKIDGCYVGIELVDFANGNVIDGGSILRCPIGIRLHGPPDTAPMNANKIIGIGIEIPKTDYADVSALDGLSDSFAPPLSKDIDSTKMPVGILLDGYTTHNVFQGVRIENLKTSILEIKSPAITTDASNNVDNYYLANHLETNDGTKYDLNSTPTVLDSGKSNIETLLRGVSTKSDMTYPYMRTFVDHWLVTRYRAGRSFMHVAFKVGVDVPYGQPHSLLKAGFVVEMRTATEPSEIWRTVDIVRVEDRTTDYDSKWIVLKLAEDIVSGNRCRISYYPDHARAVMSEVGGVIGILTSNAERPTSPPIPLPSFTHDIVIDTAQPSAATPVNTLRTGLEAYYRLAEDGVAPREDSHNGYHQDDITNAPGNEAGKFGNAISLNGTNQKIQRSVANEPAAFMSPGAHFSYNVWVNQDVLAARTIFSTQEGDGATRGHRVELLSNGAVRAHVDASANHVTTTGTPCSPAAATTPYMITVVYNGAEPAEVDRLKVYVNGSVETVTKTGGTIPTSAPSRGGKITTGWAHNGVGSYFNGWIDELALWSVTLAPGDVSILYNGGAGTFLDDFG